MAAPSTGSKATDEAKKAPGGKKDAAAGGDADKAKGDKGKGGDKKKGNKK